MITSLDVHSTLPMIRPGPRPARCAQACGIEEQHLASRMIEETIHHRGTTLVRRLILAPGEATRWHTDPFHRVSVVLKGEALLIEFHDGGASVNVAVTPGQVDWDEPGDRTHRAVNVGGAPRMKRSRLSFSPTQTTFRNRTPTNPSAEGRQFRSRIGE